MRSALFILTLALVLALACGAAAEPEEQGTKPEAQQDQAEENISKKQAKQQTKEAEKWSEEAEIKMRRSTNDGWCLNMSIMISSMDSNLYEVMGYANDGLDNPRNSDNVQFYAKVAARFFADGSYDKLGRSVTPDTEKLHRSIGDFGENLTEFHTNFEEYSDRKINRELGNLVDDFLDIYEDVGDFCQDYSMIKGY